MRGRHLPAAMRFWRFARKNVDTPEDTAVLLACTELPLAFARHADAAVFEHEGFRFVNTSVVHAHAAVRTVTRSRTDCAYPIALLISAKLAAPSMKRKSPSSRMDAAARCNAPMGALH